MVKTFLWGLVLIGGAALQAGCAGAPSAQAPDEPEDSDGAPAHAKFTWLPNGQSAWERQCALPLAGPHGLWSQRGFPGKRVTQYLPVVHQGRPAVQASSEQSMSVLRWQLDAQAQAAPSAQYRPEQVRFSWWVQGLIEGADMASRHAEDAPVRLVLTFAGDRAGFSAKNAMLSEMSRLLTGEELPYATLLYVWDSSRPVGSVIVSPFSDRIRKLVVQTGEAGLRQWQDHARDVRADFEAAFGEAPGALTSVGLMTDTDNTRAAVQAWYGPVGLR